MKVLSRLFRLLSLVVYVGIALMLLISAPILLGNRPVVVLSGSMEPAYPVGSIIYYKATAFENIQAGDAITFTIGDSSLATHRVVEIDADAQTFIVKGDANPTNDSNPVAYSAVQGKASSFAIPYAGYYTSYIKNWYVIGAAGFILLVNMLLPDGKEEKKKKMPVAAHAGFEMAACDEPNEPNAPAPGGQSGKSEAPARKKKKATNAQDYFSDL